MLCDLRFFRIIARSEATKRSILSLLGDMDCFASLAMTARNVSEVRLVSIRAEPHPEEHRESDASRRMAAVQAAILREARKCALLRMRAGEDQAGGDDFQAD